MRKIKYVQLHPSFKEPVRATKQAAGYDVRATEIEVRSESQVFCKLGFKAQLNESSKLVLVPRSGLTKHKWIVNNSPGQGDPDFPGEYQIRFNALPTGVKTKWSWKWPFLSWKLTYDEFPYEVGDRIGQVFVDDIKTTEWEKCEELEYNSDRVGGFNSTGTK